MMRNTAASLVAISVVAVLVAGGCGGGSAPGGASATTGGIRGFVFVNAAHQLIVAPVATVPAGFAPGAGAVISIAGTTVATSDSAGQFIVSRASPGLSTLHVVLASGASADLPVTVFAGATAVLGDPATTRASAIAAAKIAAVVAFPTVTAQIMGPQEPLPAGVTVAPAIPRLDLSDDPATLLVPTSPQWFFFVNPDASALYQHTVKFIYVDSQTGHVTVTDQQAWPKVNGRNYYEDATFNSTSPDLIQDAPTPRSHTVISARSAGQTVTRGPDPTRSTLALFVSGVGGTLDQPAVDLPGHCGIPVAGQNAIVVQSLSDVHPVADVLAAFRSLVQLARPGDTLYIDITAHGRGIPDATTGTVPPYGVWLPTSLNDGTPSDGDFLRPDALDFSAFKGCQVVIVASTCFAGNWILPMKAQLKPLAGTEAVVITASDITHEAFGNPGGRDGFAGPLVTHQMLIRAGKKPFDAGLQGLVDAFNEQLANGVGFAGTESNPLIFHRVPAAGEPHCGSVELSPHSASTSANGTIGLSVIQPVPGTGTFTYHWHTTGRQGTLQDSRGHSGTDFDSTSPTASYIANSSITGGATDTVAVVASQVPQGGVGQSTQLGTDQCLITLTNSAGCTQVGTPGVNHDSSCGSVAIPNSTTSIGAHFIVNVSFPGGPCGSGAGLSLTVGATSITKDGVPQSTNRPVTIQAAQGSQTVDFVIAPGTQACTGTEIDNQDPTKPPRLFGPWVVLNVGGVLIARPFTVK